MSRVLAVLAKRSYATKFHCHTSHDCFIITTAPSYAEQQASPSSYRKILSITPSGQRLRVGYGATTQSKWGWKVVEGKYEEVGCWMLCNEAEAIALVDWVISRDLMTEEANDEGE